MENGKGIFKKLSSQNLLLQEESKENFQSQQTEISLSGRHKCMENEINDYFDQIGLKWVKAISKEQDYFAQRRARAFRITGLSSKKSHQGYL